MLEKGILIKVVRVKIPSPVLVGYNIHCVYGYMHSFSNVACVLHTISSVNSTWCEWHQDTIVFCT